MSPAMVMTAESQQRVVAVDGDDSVVDHERQYQKGVKHLFENGITKVPKKYILPISERPKAINGEPHDSSAGRLNLKLPVVDFVELQGLNRSQVLETLANACQNFGFFQLVNHGIPKDVISNMMNVSGRFFGMPFEEREKYMSASMSTPVRYGTSFNQTKDGVFCWRDFLKLTCHPLSEVLPHWPSSPSDFRKFAVTYAKETKFLFLMLMEAILESLGLATTKNKTVDDDNDNDNNDIFLEEFQDGSQLMVLNCYPPCPEPDLTLGMPPHSDYGFLTLLLQDEVEGLQIQFQEKWVTVQPIANSFIVNVGDHLEIFSNGRYKSVLHRVLVNPTKPRVSVASLHSLPFKSTIQPSPKLINEENPRRYMDTDFATFLQYVVSCEPKKKNFLESRKLT